MAFFEIQQGSAENRTPPQPKQDQNQSHLTLTNLSKIFPHPVRFYQQPKKRNHKKMRRVVKAYVNYLDHHPIKTK
jgi:hypothetical protein